MMRAIVGCSIFIHMIFFGMIACNNDGGTDYGDVTNEDDDGPGTSGPNDDDDGDGIPNKADADNGGSDADGDGINDEWDADADGDGVIDTGKEDANGDGIKDEQIIDSGCEATHSCSSANYASIGAPGRDENSDGDGTCFDVEAGISCCDDGVASDLVADEFGCYDLGRCDDRTVDNEATTPKILLVVDKSRSMEDGITQGSTESRWTALLNSIDDVVTNPDISFGVLSYPVAGTTSSCNVDASPQVPFGSTASEINNYLQVQIAPGGPTPTNAALETAQRYLTGEPGGSKAVILATDGGPNCNGSLSGDTCWCPFTDNGQTVQDACRNGVEYTLNGQTRTGTSGSCIDEEEPVATAAEMAAAGIPVYVIGLTGVEQFEDVLNEIAEAGGTARSGSQKYYPAGSGSQLADAFEDIVNQLGDCTISLESAPSDEAEIVVSLGGSGGTVPEDASNGWSRTPGSGIIVLNGSACEDAADLGVTVTVNDCFQSIGEGL